MSVTPGTRIGGYEVVGPLGAGGMGEVYRARDTKLGRDVALKILPKAFASDPERIARFEREAKTLASLNHPHIAQIHGFEQSGTTSALIMELVEGEDLAQRIARGPIPIDEAIAIAKQVADALAAAHDQGIVHRDLKPANIKVRGDGTVKVLDFGLAKALQAPSLAPPAPSLLNSPTITSPAPLRQGYGGQATEAGVILGTAAYMAPEQAKGKIVDRRADIWAFGCMFYEMLTGRAAYDGETVTDVLARVIEREPDWSALPPGTPPIVERTLRRCLRKDVARRQQHIGDLRVELDDAANEPAPSRMPPRTTERGIHLAYLTAVMLLAGATAAALLWNRAPRASVSRTWEFALGDYSEDLDFYDSPVISPDGSMIAFSGAGRGTLRVRDIDSLTVRALADTERAVMPFWSRDSAHIAYTIVQPDQKVEVWRVPARGGPPIKVADAPPGVVWGAMWLPNHRILLNLAYGPESAAFFVVPDSGGTPTQVKTEEGAVLSPALLPNGDWVYTRTRGGKASLIVRRLATGVEHAVDVPELGSFGMTYADGHVFWTKRSGGVWVAPFDHEKLQVTGQSTLLARDGIYPSASDDGTLIYKRRVGGSSQLAWVDRDGTLLGPIGQVHEVITGPELTADGTRVAIAAQDGGSADRVVWTYDIARGTRARIDFGTPYLDYSAWSPTGERLAMAANWDVAIQSLDATGPARVIAGGAIVQSEPSWSRDGRYIIYSVYDGRSDLLYTTLDQGATPQKFLATPANEWKPVFSPDGKYVAYVSDESGRDEVYVREFPSGQRKQQISVNGGRFPRWSSRQDEIFFVGDQSLMSAAITQGRVATAAPRPLFSAAKVGVSGIFEFDVTPDGKRFVVARTLVPRERRAAVVEHWRSRLASTP